MLFGTAGFSLRPDRDYSPNGRLLRILSPSTYTASHPAAFADYWTKYTSDLYRHFANHTLTVDTQSAYGRVTCRSDTTSNATASPFVICEGDETGYDLPSAGDIFSCNTGPFTIGDADEVRMAVVPRLCAAFNRATFLSKGGDFQPGPSVDEYYAANAPKNWYSATVHKHQIDGKGYAFAYDDVTPTDGFDVAGIVSDCRQGSAYLLRVFVGGYPED